METKILNAINGLLEESLEIEELEKRVEMLIMSPELMFGETAHANCDYDMCPRDNCDNNRCPQTVRG